jgi:hypothetical protein
MDLVLDLLQGAGIAAAVGIRPFLPVLLVGALASGIMLASDVFNSGSSVDRLLFGTLIGLSARDVALTALAAALALDTLGPRGFRGETLAALAAVACGGGFLAGAVTRGGATESATVLIPMHGTAALPNARASIALLTADKAGNWPMRFTVQGLPKLPHGAYYELYVTKNGRITASCGVFNVHGGRTTVTLNAPYTKGFNGWIVTRHVPGHAAESTRPVLTT